MPSLSKVSMAATLTKCTPPAASGGLKVAAFARASEESSPREKQQVTDGEGGKKETWEDPSHGLTCIPRCSCPLNNVSAQICDSFSGYANPTSWLSTGQFFPSFERLRGKCFEDSSERVNYLHFTL